MKRSAGEEAAGQHQHKKHRHSNDSRQDRDRQGYGRDNYQQRNGRNYEHTQNGQNQRNGPPPQKKQAISHEEALAKLPPATAQLAEVPAYIPFNTARGLPNLPDIKPGPLTTAPFKHKSLSDITYERLEFLGDGYIEVIARRLVFERYPTLAVGRQSQLKELLVKNETLAEYSRAYGFEERIEIGDKDRMLDEVLKKGNMPGNKGFNKVLGDVFEAYVAAVVLSDVEHGFAVVEKWLTALWAPKLLENAPRANGSLTHPDFADPLSIYNPEAKAQLQKRILGSPDVKLEYDRYQNSVELKGAQLGQSKHFIAVYLTGYGYEKKLLGRGEGRNKVEAGNWAAQQAMYGESKGIVEECEKVCSEAKEKRKREREAKEAAAATAAAN